MQHSDIQRFKKDDNYSGVPPRGETLQNTNSYQAVKNLPVPTYFFELPAYSASKTTKIFKDVCHPGKIVIIFSIFEP
jgi:hypothetical protein